MRLVAPLLAAALLPGCVAHAATPPAPDEPTARELGRLLFFDESISARGNQSCATCHGAEVGFTGPDEAINLGGSVYEGSVHGRFGNRKPTTVAYASWSPVLHVQAGQFVGGNFWDGRATGELFGDPAIDQAQGPPLNPLEQALPDAAAVMERVCAAPYADRFTAAWGEAACTDPDVGFEAFARSVAAYERGPEVSPFSSKYDAVLAGTARLTGMEARGLALFTGKAACATCHTLGTEADGSPPLFTSFGYENIGVPRNPDNPFYGQDAFNPDGAAWVDPGLGGFLASRPEWADLADANLGRHRVPSLRNVDARPSRGFVKAYGHNGYFKSLAEVVHFYNTRDALPRCEPGDPGEKTTCWPAPEVAANLSMQTGNLGLSRRDERAIVAFLGTLTDGWSPPGRHGR